MLCTCSDVLFCLFVMEWDRTWQPDSESPTCKWTRPSQRKHLSLTDCTLQLLVCRDKSTAGRTQSCQEALLIVDIIMLSQFHVVSNKKFLIHLQFILYSKTEMTLLKAELRSVFLGSPGAVAVHVYG